MAARVLQATDDAAGAELLIERGAQWLQATAARIPEAWPDGFLRRRPENSSLLAKAAAHPLR